MQQQRTGYVFHRTLVSKIFPGGGPPDPPLLFNNLPPHFKNPAYAPDLTLTWKRVG